MITEVKKNIWKLTFKLFGSTVYLVKLRGKNILIDTSSFVNRIELKHLLKELDLKPEEIDVVLLTHNHFDHTGNVKIFKNAKVYGSKLDFEKKILNRAFSKDLPKNKLKSFVGEKFEEVFANQFESEEDRKVEGILPLEKFDMKEFEIIGVPGHTKGSVVFFMPKEKVLFSGDHIFDNGYIGRTDLPNSLPEKMKGSLEKMKKIDYKILCAGHTY